MRTLVLALLLVACSDSSGPCDFQMAYVTVGSENEQAQREALADLKADGWRCDTVSESDVLESYACERC